MSRQNNYENTGTSSHQNTSDDIDRYLLLGQTPAARDAFLSELQATQRAGARRPAAGQTDNYNDYGETNPAHRAGDRLNDANRARDNAVKRFVVPPPPEFKDLMTGHWTQDPNRAPYPPIIMPPGPVRPGPGQNPGGDGRVPVRPGPWPNPGGDGRLPGPGQNPGDGRVPTRPGSDTRPNPGDGSIQPHDDNNVWKWILGSGAAYGAYRFLRNYVQRDDSINRLTDRVTVKLEPVRDGQQPSEPSLTLRNKKTGEEIDRKTFDGKTFANKDGKSRVALSDVEIEIKMAQPQGTPAEQKKQIEETRARLRGHLDLQLRGRENLGTLLNDVSVRSDTRAAIGSKRFVLETDGKQLEIKGATPDGKLKVIGTDGKLQEHELKAGDKAVMLVGGENGGKVVSTKDATNDLTKLLGQQSDVQMAKLLAEFARRESGTDLGSKLDSAATRLAGEQAQAMRDVAQALKHRGIQTLDATERMALADALRERANSLGDGKKDYSDGLRAAADKIMPPDVAAEVKRLQLQAAAETARTQKPEEENAEKKKAEEEAAAKKKTEEEAAAKKKTEEEAAAKKKTEEEAAAKKKTEEEAAAKKKTEEEAAAKKKTEEAGNGGDQPERKRRKRQSDELDHPELEKRPDGGLATKNESLGSLVELAKREKLEKRHVDGMEAYLAKLKQEQADKADPSRQREIDRLGETISILRGERGATLQREANRGIIDAVGKELERRRGGGAAGVVVSAELLTSIALVWYASTLDKTEDPLDRAKLGS